MTNSQCIKRWAQGGTGYYKGFTVRVQDGILRSYNAIIGILYYSSKLQRYVARISTYNNGDSITAKHQNWMVQALKEENISTDVIANRFLNTLDIVQVVRAEEN